MPNHNPWYSGQRAAQIEPTADTLALIGEAIRLLRTIWRPGFRYSVDSVGIPGRLEIGISGRLRIGMHGRLHRNPQLFQGENDAHGSRPGRAAEPAVSHSRSGSLGQDHGSTRYDQRTLRPRHSSACLHRDRPVMGARQQNLSPRYTTRIGEILIAQAFRKSPKSIRESAGTSRPRHYDRCHSRLGGELSPTLPWNLDGAPNQTPSIHNHDVDFGCGPRGL
jgi:DNA polymerase V